MATIQKKNLRQRQPVKIQRCHLVMIKKIRMLRLSSQKTLLAMVVFFAFLIAIFLKSSYEFDHSSKYLVYYNHSGLSNQIFAMERAASLALATNRTLVLPPVLPHKGDGSKTLSFPEFKGRTCGSRCEPYDKYDQYIEVAMDDVNKVSNYSASAFPSFLELFDFDKLTRSGLQLIDMKEFAKIPLNSKTHDWCKGGQTVEKKMVPFCDKSDKLSFEDLVPYFRKFCNKQRVAVIASPYVMPRPDPTTYTGTGSLIEINKFFKNIDPSPKFLLLLQEMHSRLPKDYAGVHIRFNDELVLNNCDDVVTERAFNDVVTGLKDKNARNGKHILIGNSKRGVLRCFRHHANGQYTASTINELIDSDRKLQHLVEGIKTENSTIYVLLDQILIGLANTLILTSVETSANTFHTKIKQRHNRRQAILEQMRMAMFTKI